MRNPHAGVPFTVDEMSDGDLAAALEDIDVALAGAADEQRVQSLWTQRVALLAGLNEQATDPLPLGRVDWVQVD